jgi:hypothetical protein
MKEALQGAIGQIDATLDAIARRSGDLNEAYVIST